MASVVIAGPGVGKTTIAKSLAAAVNDPRIISTMISKISANAKDPDKVKKVLFGLTSRNVTSIVYNPLSGLDRDEFFGVPIMKGFRREMLYGAALLTYCLIIDHSNTFIHDSDSEVSVTNSKTFPSRELAEAFVEENGSGTIYEHYKDDSSSDLTRIRQSIRNQGLEDYYATQLAELKQLSDAKFDGIKRLAAANEAKTKFIELHKLNVAKRTKKRSSHEAFDKDAYDNQPGSSDIENEINASKSIIERKDEAIRTIIDSLKAEVKINPTKASNYTVLYTSKRVVKSNVQEELAFNMAKADLIKRTISYHFDVTSKAQFDDDLYDASVVSMVNFMLNFDPSYDSRLVNMLKPIANSLSDVSLFDGYTSVLNCEHLSPVLVGQDVIISSNSLNSLFSKLGIPGFDKELLISAFDSEVVSTIRSELIKFEEDSSDYANVLSATINDKEFFISALIYKDAPINNCVTVIGYGEPEILTNYSNAKAVGAKYVEVRGKGFRPLLEAILASDTPFIIVDSLRIYMLMDGVLAKGGLNKTAVSMATIFDYLSAKTGKMITLLLNPNESGYSVGQTASVIKGSVTSVYSLDQIEGPRFVNDIREQFLPVCQGFNNNGEFLSSFRYSSDRAWKKGNGINALVDRIISDQLVEAFRNGNVPESAKTMIEDFTLSQMINTFNTQNYLG